MTSTSSILRDNSKALYQPWREEAFRADEYVQALTPVEKWMLRALLQAAFVCSQRPYLPDDDGRLWILAGCESREQWDQHKAAVRSMFTPVERNGERLLSQKKLIEDWDRIHEAHTARVEAGRKGGRAKAVSNNRGADEGGTEGTEGNSTEGNQPNQPTEVTELNVASHCSSNAREGRLEGRSVSAGARPAEAQSEGASPSSQEDSSSPSSLGSASAKTASVSPRPSGVEKPSCEGDEGNVNVNTNVKSAGSGQNKGRVLLEWQAEFQRKVQRTAADLDCGGHGVVFSVPLPDKIFQCVKRMSQGCGMQEAQAAIIRWLESRSFNGLDNPNVVWDKMEDEVLPFIDELIQRNFEKASCSEL
jgi:hypothetical protein